LADFTDIYVAESWEQSDKILDGLPRAEAHYDSSLRNYASSCMKGTRISILQKVQDWMSSDSPKELVFWRGPAGAGKSTIAQTVAEECSRRKWLGASFFFTHGNAECSDPNLFFTTIAYQLANFNPQFRKHIVDGIREHSGSASIRAQCLKYIIQPLCKLSKGCVQHPVIVVVDALDECSEKAGSSLILELLAAEIVNIPFSFNLARNQFVHNGTSWF